MLLNIFGVIQPVFQIQAQAFEQNISSQYTSDTVL